MKELEFKPIAFFKMDDDTPFTDYSGFGVSATRTGTELRGLQLTSSASYSQNLDSTRVATFNVADFVTSGTVEQEASITFSVYATGTADFSLAHAGDNMEILVSPTGITVTMVWPGAVSIEAATEFAYNRKHNVAVVYTSRALMLYDNGKLVANTAVTEEARALDFAGTDDSWVTGTTGSVTMNNLAFYRTALSGDQVKKIHEYNSRHVVEDVPAAFGGETVKFSTDVRKPSMEVVWDTAAEWNSGAHEQTVVDGNQLQAQRQDSLTVEGKWDNSITFTSPVPLSTFHSAYIIWEGKNVDIEVSIDNTTWITPVFGENLSIIPAGFDPNDETLLVRVNFEDGLDEGYLEKLVFRAFTGPDSNSHIDERIITYTNPAFTWDEQEPNNMIDFWGVRLEGGTVTVNPDPNMSVKTVEVWFKLDGPSTAVMNLPGPADSLYVNGVLNGTFAFDQWIVAHYVYNSAFTDDFSITGDLTVGRVAVYPDTLTQDQVSRIIQSYTGYPKSLIDDGSSITVAEPTTPATIYDLAWSNRIATQ